MASAIQPAHESVALSRVQRGLIMATVTFATAIIVVDIFVIGLALPHMQGTFSATPDQISWVAIAFILGSTVMIVATGWLSARVGAKRLFIVSIIGFMLFSVLCANARSLEEEVLWRLAMGLFAAPISPVSQVIILNTYPREQHGQALARWGLGVMVAPVIAYPLAGVVINFAGWPGMFYMSLPIAGIAILGAILFVPRSKAEPRQRLDWFGLMMLVGVFALLQFVLSRGARLDWLESTAIVFACAMSATCAYLFLVHLFTTRHPLIPPDIFRNRNFAFGTIGTFIFGATTMLVTLLVPLMLQNQLGYPVELIGLIMAPRTVGTLIGQYLVAILITRVDPRHLITLGVLAAATATWIMSGWSLVLSPWQVIWPGILHGAGGGILWVCFNSMTVSTLERRHRAHGVSFYFLAFNVGFSMGVATIMTYWVNSSQQNYALLTEHITPFNELMRAPLVPPDWNPADPEVAATLAMEISRQAAMIAYNNCFVVASIAVLLIIPIAYLMKDPGWRPIR